jgi:hypothetical protein
VIERRRVFPPFPERRDDVSGRRPIDLELHVAPRRTRSVPLIDLNRLLVAVVTLRIPPTVAEVDPTDERDIGARPADCTATIF